MVKKKKMSLYRVPITRNQELAHTNIYTGSLIEPGFSFRLFGLEYRWNPATRGGCRHDRQS